MNPQPPHFIIEEGPERGRELIIPPEGARIGRATENDICLADAAMSRFQCRIYFRDGFLHVMDLGSTNETLLNDEPVSDQPLRHGDQILIGESVLRVVNDGLSAAPAPGNLDAQRSKPTAAAEPAPIIFQPEIDDEPPPAPIDVPEPKPKSPSKAASKPAPAPESKATPKSAATLAEEQVDLGLGRKNASLEEEQESSSKVNLLLVTLGTMLVAMLVGVTYLFLSQGPTPQTTQNRQQEETLRIYYERVRSGEGNIFRYAVEVTDDGRILAAVHDIQNQHNIVAEHVMTPESYQQLRSRLLALRDNFFRLRDTYEGVPLDVHESRDLTLVMGRDVKRVRVADQLEPDAFKAVRDQIKSVVNQELGLHAIDMPPEVLRAEAQKAWDNARKLYAERTVRDRNLWDAIQQLRQVDFLLRTIEPKPEYFREAARLREEWNRALNTRVQAIEFEAVREYQVGNKERAAELYRRILATLPDRSHQEYTNAHAMLVTIEQELNR